MWVTYDAISRGSLTWPAQTIDPVLQEAALGLFKATEAKLAPAVRAADSMSLDRSTSTAEQSVQ